MKSRRIRTRPGADGDHARERRERDTVCRRYAELVDRMPLGVVIVVREEVRFANRMAARMCGAGVSDLVGRPLRRWLRPDDRHRLQALLEAQVSGQDTGPVPARPALEAEVWAHAADGMPRHWRLHAQAMPCDGADARLVTLVDITDFTRAQQRMRELASIVEQASDAIMLTAADGTIRYVNPGFERLTGYRCEEVVGKTPALFKSGAHDAHFYRQLWETVRNGQTFRAQVLNRRKDGSTYHAIKTITPMFDDDGQLVSFVNIDKDFSEQHAAQERLAQLALHDPLTGLANRAQLEDHVREAIVRNRHADAPFALLFVDLDGFKAINDSQGHRVGDLVLQKMARRLQSRTRDTDMVARLGGDEFVLLLPGVAEATVAARIAEQLLREIRLPIDTEAGPAVLGASIGMAVYPRDGCDVQALLHGADQAMYRAKRAGGSRVLGVDEATCSDAADTCPPEAESRA